MVRPSMLAAAFLTVTAGTVAARADVCAPVTLSATTSAFVHQLVGDDANLYWLRLSQSCNGGTDLVRTPKAGGAGVVLATFDGNVDGLALGGGTLYVLSAGTIWAVSATAGGARVLAAMAPDRWHADVAADASAVYAIDLVPGDTEIVRIAADGSGTTVLASGLCDGAGSLVVDDTSLYFASQTGAWRLPLGGGMRSLVASGSPWMLALDGDALILGTGSGLERVAKSGGAATTIVSYPQDNGFVRGTAAIAVDASAVYFATADYYQYSTSEDHAYAIWRVDRDGSNLERISYGWTAALVADGSALYSVETFDGLVRRDVACAPGAVTVATVDACAPRVIAPAQTGFHGDGDAIVAWDGAELHHIAMNGAITPLWSHAGIHAVAFDADAFYALDGSNAWRVPRDGSAPTLLAATPFDVVWLDDASVYVSPSYPSVVRVPKTGGTAVPATPSPGTRFFGVDARGVYGIVTHTGGFDLWRRDATGSDALVVTAAGGGPNLTSLDIVADTVWASCYNAYGSMFTSFSLTAPSQTVYCGRGYGDGTAVGLDLADGISLISDDEYGEGPGAWPNSYTVVATRSDGMRAWLREGHELSGGAAITTDSFVWQTADGVERVPRSCAFYCNAVAAPPVRPPKTLGCMPPPPPPPPPPADMATSTDGGVAPPVDASVPPSWPPVGGGPVNGPPAPTHSGGPPDNAGAPGGSAAPSSGGCSATPARAPTGSLPLVLIAGVLALAIARRRPA